MVALVPDVAISRQLLDAADGDEPLREQHITLAYCGSTDEVDREAIQKAVFEFAVRGNIEPITGHPNGWGVFDNGEQHVLWACWDVPGLAALRTDLVRALDAAGVSAKTDHDFAPHQTMKYSDDRIERIPTVPDLDDHTFDHVVLAYGGDWTVYPFL